MVGPFFVGLFTGLLGAQAVDQYLDDNTVPGGGPPQPGPLPPHVQSPNEATIREASAVFLPAAAEAIAVVREADPKAPAKWKKMAGYLPGLTESVAMFYTMMDPKVPTAPKLAIAGSLLYFVSPIDIIPDHIPVVGQLDDLGVLLSAFRYVAGYISADHMDKANAWLRRQGVEPTPVFKLGRDPGQIKQLPKKDNQPPAAPPQFELPFK